MSKFTDFQKAFSQKMSAAKSPVSHVPTQDQVSYVAKLGNQVYDWLNRNGYCKQGTSTAFAHAMENYSMESKLTEEVVDQMAGFLMGLESSGLGFQMNDFSSKVLADTIYQSIDLAAGKNAGQSWGKYLGATSMRPANNGEKLSLIGIESFIPESMMSDFFDPNQIAKESFGVDIDKALPDMKTSITIGIMKFLNGVTGKLFGKKMLPEPMIYMNTDEVLIYKTDSTDAEIPMVELNRDPDIVNVELTRITPREANDTVGDLLTEDGYVRMNVGTVPLLKLAIDTSKPAFASVNKTDLISDDVRMESVVCTFSDGTLTESFEFKVPTALSRLVYSANGATSRRVANITWDAFITAASVNRAGVTTTCFNALHADDVAVVNITINPVIDLRTGDFSVTGSMNLRVQNKTSLTVAANATSVAELATVTTRTLASCKPDARYSEENMKKTNIGGEVITHTYAYNIPVGRNYFMDYAFNQQFDADHSTALLMNVINYGLDSRSLKIIKAKIEETRDKWVNYIPTTTYFQPGAGYVCSNRIKPAAIVGTFDASKYETMKELEKMADIHTAALIQLNGIVTKIDADSYINRELVGGQMTYRVVTDVHFLGNVLGINRMHDRLRQSAPPLPANGTVTAVVQLNSGCTLEIVSVPFDNMKDRIIGIPYIEADPESTLNFAINADMGSLVAHYQSDYAGLKHRLFTNVRELPIVCNPSGFSLNITGVPAELHMAQYIQP